MFALTIVNFVCLGQNSIEAELIEHTILSLKTNQYELLKTKKASYNDAFIFAYIECQIEKNTSGKISDSTYYKYSLTKPSSTIQKALDKLNQGDYLYSKNEYSVSKYLNEYEQALRIGKELNNKPIICEAYKRICNHYLNTQKNISSLKENNEEYKNYIYDDFEFFYFNYFRTNYLMQYAYGTTKRIDITHIDNLIKLSRKNNLSLLKAKAYQLKSVYYMMFENNLDSAIFYIDKSKKEYAYYDTPFILNEKIGLDINKSIILQKKGKHNTAIQLLDSLNNTQTSLTNPRFKLSIAQFLKEGYKSLNAYDKAFYYQQIENQIKDSLDLINQDLEFAEIKAKYDTSENEKKLLIEQQQKKKNRNIAIGLGGSLALGSIIAFLLFKNIKRKQKLAEQEKELETQKLATVLKEQELTAIDAMIEGQEKERQRIANDLHDDLGGLMATVKLHFNALKEKQTPELYSKTNQLIDEAYNKVRTVAHAKNSGVIAKQGLLKAITEMAEKISASNSIKIDVLDHGLENRLENSLELTIFRIIQELITNVIKHANATEATIHITNHEDSLNLMVEDNGKGFNTSQITKTNKGMGISSIDKRVEHLNGTMTIESEKQKGTTVIIDLPL
ncbi:sensor histidine kinase [Psychroserpens luteolus]|uniref:sensor histidine kinase n=1 Tax=Psychroserpens luteolus TaxID=2855840 RepID=UPI001E64E27C|nr:sensor histidine kinase [Psychroserpens luteolus]MCD2260431.1 sensor histidine kinase [Psychroserpens luteolus]